MSARTPAKLLALTALLGLLLQPGNTTLADEGTTFDIDIPYKKYVLDNGLTLIVHEDHKAPIAAVNVWYHVGSKNERAGRTGFAHLFEHLMFNGSENFDDDYFQAMARIGATDLNGTTNEDRTNYFQNVPVSALDSALWMESDRMGHLLGAVTQEKLDEQRGVVQNEKRQGENQPYAVARELITKNTYPAGHPYSWTVIGSMEDLDAASLEDVHEWFKQYYGPANAVIVVAGAVDPEDVRKRVESHFGDIPSGPPVGRPEVWVAKRSGTVRHTVEDRVPHSRVYKVWNVPPIGDRDTNRLELFAGVLAGGKNSRLYKRLVYEEEIARNVFAFVDTREISSQFRIQATAHKGVDLERVERAVDEEIARLLDEGPTEAELQLVKTQFFADFVRGSERIGGFGGKSDILAISEVYGDSPETYKTLLEDVRQANASGVRDVARRWLSDGVFVLEVHPFPEYGVASEGVDRAALPSPGETPEANFVALERDRLSNGLEIVLAERHATPVIELNLMVDGGFAADQFAAPGTARLAMDMIDEGAGRLDALEISEKLALLGANMGAGSNLDVSNIFLSALKANLDDSLAIYADVILRPSFPLKEFERRRRQQLASIEAEKAQPVQMALRVFPGLLYGKDHAYGTPFTGSGMRETVEKMTREDLVKFHKTWFRPNNATLVVVGDTTMAEIKPKLARLFGGWEKGKVPTKNLARVKLEEKPTVYLMDKPGAIQSIIIAGHVAPARNESNQIALETMNTILGGTFISRLNMNLREDKHWSYGARTMVLDAKGQRPFLAFAPVQTDKTKESMVEVLRELEGIIGERPITDQELGKIKEKKVLELPGSWETNGAVLASISEIVRFGLEDDYFDGYADAVRSLSLQHVSQAAEEVVHPAGLVWIVVGDREKIEPGIRELGYGDIALLDGDGNRIR